MVLVDEERAFVFKVVDLLFFGAIEGIGVGCSSSEGYVGDVSPVLAWDADVPIVFHGGYYIKRGRRESNRGYGKERGRGKGKEVFFSGGSRHGGTGWSGRQGSCKRCGLGRRWRVWRGDSQSLVSSIVVFAVDEPLVVGVTYFETCYKGVDEGEESKALGDGRVRGEYPVCDIEEGWWGEKVPEVGAEAAESEESASHMFLFWGWVG